MAENKYQMELVKTIRSWDSDIWVFPMDGSVYQGFQDILILYRDTYALLEAKVSEDAEHQPNQDWYVEYFSKYVFSSFIYPEIEEEVLYDLQQSLLFRR